MKNAYTRNGVTVSVDHVEGKKLPGLLLSFEGEPEIYKVATFRGSQTARWFLEVMEEFFKAREEPQESPWVSVEDHLPEEFVSVQAHMTDAGPFPSVREGYLAGGRWFFPALDEYHPVDRWRAFDTLPKEDAHAES